MLTKESWLPRAAGLGLGGKRRLDHDCGGGRTLTIRRDERGLNAFCFRCNDSGHAPAEPEPLSVRLARLAKVQAQDELTRKSVDLPYPRAVDWSEWPPECCLWLIKAGLSRGDMPALGAYYHPPTNRVVLPVLMPLRGIPEVVFWQARAVDKRQPKYLAPEVDKAGVLARYGNAEVVTLTEDILSAYKVGTVGEGWSMLGTSISKTMTAALLERNCKVNVWLDSDKAGRKAATKVHAALRAVGIKSRDICTTKDPKLIHRAMIKELI